MKILLADDNQDLAEALALLLEDEDHQVAVVYDGESAVSRACTEDFDVIFMDFKMPDIHGVEAMVRIRETKPDVRIIIMTGYRMDQVLEQLVDQGRVCLFAKPFTAERLLATLELVGADGIVVVDVENPEALVELESLLADLDRQTLVLHTPDEAIEKVRRQPYGVLLLDLERPLIETAAVYFDLKTNHRAVPTFMAIRRGKEELRTRNILHSTRATGCFFKPFEPDEMLDWARGG